MIYFAFIDHGDTADSTMALLRATAPEAAMDEARDELRLSPGAITVHVFDGDLFVGSVDAPAFGFAATNNTGDFGAPALLADRAVASARTGATVSGAFV